MDANVRVTNFRVLFAAYRARLQGYKDLLLITGLQSVCLLSQKSVNEASVMASVVLLLFILAYASEACRTL